MTDNEVLSHLLSALSTGLNDNGFPSPLIKQAYQPNQQGIEAGPAWYIHRLSTHKYGHPGRVQVKNEANNNFDVTETRILESTYQITAYSRPADPVANPDLTLPNSFDMADVAAAVVESTAFSDTIREQGIRVYRVTDIREPYFTNDSDQNELSPNFDFTVTYNRELTSTVGLVERATDNLNNL